MKPTFTIIRVSSQDQMKGYGPDNQWNDDVIPNAPLLGLEVSEQYRRIIQESATGWNRPLFESTVREAIALYQKGEIEALLFPRQDRESRFIYGSFPLLIEVIKTGLEVYFAREKFRLDPNNTETTERYLNKASQAQAYVETMKINTARGRKARALRGKLSGGHSPFGYSYLAGKGQGEGVRYEVPEQSKWVKLMFEWLVKERLSINAITHRLRAMEAPTPGSQYWLRQSVHRILTNTCYCGKTYVYKHKFGAPKTRKAPENGQLECTRNTGCVIRPREEWLLVPNATPAIISEELFNAAQSQLQRNKELSERRSKHEYLLKGYIFCQKCGRRYQGYVKKWKDNGKPNEARYYRCGNSLAIYKPEKCTNKQLNAKHIETEVWNLIGEIVSDPSVWVNKYREKEAEAQKNSDQVIHWQNEIVNINDKLKVLDRRKNTAYKAFLIDENENQYKTEIALIEADKQAFMRSKTDFETKISSFSQSKIDLENITKTCQEIKEVLPSLDYEGKRDLLESLAIRVLVDGEDVSIEGFLPNLKLKEVSRDSPYTGLKTSFPFYLPTCIHSNMNGKAKKA